MSKLTIKERYGVTPNAVLNLETLSFKAKGIFGYIQSKPDGWKFSAKKIAQQSKDGAESINAGLQELETHGFLTRTKFKNDAGQWDWDYCLLEKPVLEKPSMVSPSMENHPNISKKDIVNKISKKDSIRISKEIQVPIKTDSERDTEFDVVLTNGEGDEVSPRKKPQTWDVEKAVFASFVKKCAQVGLPEPEPVKLWQLQQIRNVLKANTLDVIDNILEDWVAEASDDKILNIHAALSAHNLNKYKMK